MVLSGRDAGIEAGTLVHPGQEVVSHRDRVRPTGGEIRGALASTEQE